MAKKELSLILLSVILIVSAQLLLKYGLQSLGKTSAIIPFFINSLLNPYVITGIALFIASAVIWLLIVSRAELSYAYPALSLGYALAAIGAWLLFGENLSITRIAGIAIITTGVVALSRT